MPLCCFHDNLLQLAALKHYNFIFRSMLNLYISICTALKKTIHHITHLSNLHVKVCRDQMTYSCSPLYYSWHQALENNTLSVSHGTLLRLTVDYMRTWNSLQHPHKPELRPSDSSYHCQAQSVDWQVMTWGDSLPHKAIKPHTCMRAQAGRHKAISSLAGKYILTKMQKECNFTLKNLLCHCTVWGR